MSEPFVFDPRCDLCKEPFGAVPCGTAVTFHCRPLATEGFSHCALVLSCEFSGTQREQELPLEGAGSTRTGMTRRSGGRIRMGRSATGTSLVALWRGSRRNWTI